MNFADAVFQPGFHSLIDTHCHYNLDPLYEDWQRHWQQAQAAGVLYSWLPGTNLQTSRRAVELAHLVPEFSAFIGIHPTEIADIDFDWDTVRRQLSLLKEQAAHADKPIMGVGEIGLDYFRLEPDAEHQRQEQKVWLRAQLQLALAWQLPVVLHVRDKNAPEQPESDNAYWDVLRIVEEVFALQPHERHLPVDVTLHCVSGPAAYVQKMIAYGAYAGFDGNITYPNAAAIRALWRIVPADRRLLETDAPYLPPQGYRGQVCEPWMIRETADYITTKAVSAV